MRNRGGIFNVANFDAGGRQSADGGLAPEPGPLTRTSTLRTP